MIAKPKPTKQKRTGRKFSKSRRAILEKQLEDIVRMIVFWRDGGQCVLANIDGHRCGGKMNWGHFIPRARSKYLKYDLATFVQCDSHNLIHDSRKTGGGDPIFGLWFAQTFGLEALQRISQEQREHLGADGKHSIADLEEMLAHYDDLYQNRFYVDTTFDGLVQGGYYGEVIKSAIMEAKCTNKLP